MKNLNSSPRNIKKKILLVEDDNAIRRYIEVVLKKEDYEVTVAEDGLSAIRLTFSNDFDVILTDAMMPNLSGHDLCRMVRQNPAKKDTSMVIMSGIESNIGESLADAYLTKDVNFKENLVAAVSKLANKSISQTV